MRISDWSSDVCSSDLVPASNPPRAPALAARWSPKQIRGGGQFCARSREQTMSDYIPGFGNHISTEAVAGALPVGQNSPQRPAFGLYTEQLSGTDFRSEEHTSELQSLLRISYAVFCLKKKR